MAHHGQVIGYDVPTHPTVNSIFTMIQAEVETMLVFDFQSTPKSTKWNYLIAFR